MNKGNMNKGNCLNDYAANEMDGYQRPINEMECLLSSHVKIKVAGKPIRAIQKFNYAEGVDANGKVLIFGHCVRTFFDKTSILEAFTGLSVIDPNKKIDIELSYLDKTIVLKNTNVNNHFITFDAKSYMIEENIGFIAENIVVITS